MTTSGLCVSVHVRARALWGLTRNLRKPRNTAKCLPTPSLHFCYPGATGLRFRPGRQPAVEPAAPLSGTTLMMHGAPALVLAQHLGRNLRFKGSPLCDRPRSNSCRHQCRSRQAPSEHARPVLGQSEQWSSPVKPPRSQNYVRFKGSPVCDRPRSNSCRHQCRSRHAPSEHARPVLGQRTMEFTS